MAIVNAPVIYNTYGDISPRTAAYAVRELLKRGDPLLVLERFGQAKTLPQKSTQTMKFRRYEALEPATTPLTEGVTPSGKLLTKTDVTTVLRQYGDFVGLTKTPCSVRRWRCAANRPLRPSNSCATACCAQGPTSSVQAEQEPETALPQVSPLACSARS